MLTGDEVGIITQAMGTISQIIEYTDRVDELPAVEAPKLRRECGLMLRDLFEVLGVIVATHTGESPAVSLPERRPVLSVCEEPGERSSQLRDLSA